MHPLVNRHLVQRLRENKRPGFIALLRRFAPRLRLHLHRIIRHRRRIVAHHQTHRPIQNMERTDRPARGAVAAPPVRLTGFEIDADIAPIVVKAHRFQQIQKLLRRQLLRLAGRRRHQRTVRPAVPLRKNPLRLLRERLRKTRIPFISDRIAVMAQIAHGIRIAQRRQLRLLFRRKHHGRRCEAGAELNAVGVRRRFEPVDRQSLAGIQHIAVHRPPRLAIADDNKLTVHHLIRCRKIFLRRRPHGNPRPLARAAERIFRQRIHFIIVIQPLRRRHQADRKPAAGQRLRVGILQQRLTVAAEHQPAVPAQQFELHKALLHVRRQIHRLLRHQHAARRPAHGAALAQAGPEAHAVVRQIVLQILVFQPVARLQSAVEHALALQAAGADRQHMQRIGTQRLELDADQKVVRMRRFVPELKVPAHKRAGLRTADRPVQAILRQHLRLARLHPRLEKGIIILPAGLDQRHLVADRFKLRLPLGINQQLAVFNPGDPRPFHRPRIERGRRVERTAVHQLRRRAETQPGTAHNNPNPSPFHSLLLAKKTGRYRLPSDGSAFNQFAGPAGNGF